MDPLLARLASLSPQEEYQFASENPMLAARIAAAKRAKARNETGDPNFKPDGQFMQPLMDRSMTKSRQNFDYGTPVQRKMYIDAINRQRASAGQATAAAPVAAAQEDPVLALRQAITQQAMNKQTRFGKRVVTPDSFGADNIEALRAPRAAARTKADRATLDARLAAFAANNGVQMATPGTADVAGSPGASMADIQSAYRKSAHGSAMDMNRQKWLAKAINRGVATPGQIEMGIQSGQIQDPMERRAAQLAQVAAAQGHQQQFRPESTKDQISGQMLNDPDVGLELAAGILTPERIAEVRAKRAAAAGGGTAQAPVPQNPITITRPQRAGNYEIVNGKLVKKGRRSVMEMPAFGTPVGMGLEAARRFFGE